MALTLAQKLKSIALHFHHRTVVAKSVYEERDGKMVLVPPVIAILVDGVEHHDPLDGSDCPECVAIFTPPVEG